MTVDRFRLLFEFEFWANQRVLDSLREAGAPGAGLRLFAHILAAQDVWLVRLLGEDSSRIAIWPDRSFDECAVEAERLERAIREFLDALQPPSLPAEIRYRNQTGREFHNTAEDVLTHLGLHSQHHRGQIALELRRLGAAPAVTDFIAFRRQGQ